MQFWIRLSPRLLEAITLAGVEAYCLGDGVSPCEIETLGYLWGHKNVRSSQTVIYLDRVAISQSAVRGSDYVQPNQQSAKLQNSIVQSWSPQISLLGDFHTHPYKDMKQVMGVKGFEFSDADFRYGVANDAMWEASGKCPVMLALTICRMRRVRFSTGSALSDNLWMYNVGEFRCWLNASVGFVDENGERRFTKNAQPEPATTYLDLNPIFWNEAGARVAQS